MKLYHGSHVEVRNPKILTSARIGDFGKGFYATSSIEQARRWAQIRAKRENLTAGVVSVFDVPDNLYLHPELRVKRFEVADEKWLDFVLANRRDVNFYHEFDIIFLCPLSIMDSTDSS